MPKIKQHKNEQEIKREYDDHQGASKMSKIKTECTVRFK